MSDELLRIRDWDAIYENNRSREYKKLNWVPIPNRMDGDGYTELVDHPNGAAHFGAWIAIVQVASRSNPRGCLVRDGGRPHDAASLARITRLPVDIFREAIPRLLASIGWLKVVPPADVPQDAAETSQDAAGFSQFKYAEQNRTELNRTEIQNTCASGDARLGDSGSVPFVDERPFETTEPEALSSGEPKPDPQQERRRLDSGRMLGFRNGGMPTGSREAGRRRAMRSASVCRRRPASIGSWKLLGNSRRRCSAGNPRTGRTAQPG